MNQQDVIPDQQTLTDLKNKIVVIKYGGNAMVDDELKHSVMSSMAMLLKLGIKPVIVHGGGPVIEETLKMAGIPSEFVDGHRKTDKASMRFVEMALCGAVNGSLVSLLNTIGGNAVGLSGKDGSIARVEKRYHHVTTDNETTSLDLGQVGNVTSVNPGLIHNLLDNNFIPVIAPVCLGQDGYDYNVNADMFAGHIAAALQAEAYVVLTDVDGLMEDISRPESLITDITVDRLKQVMPKIVKGGMIPKVESCMIALKQAKRALVINGTRKHAILQALLTKQPTGTQITV